MGFENNPADIHGTKISPQGHGWNTMGCDFEDDTRSLINKEN